MHRRDDRCTRTTWIVLCHKIFAISLLKLGNGIPASLQTDPPDYKLWILVFCIGTLGQLLHNWSGAANGGIEP